MKNNYVNKESSSGVRRTTTQPDNEYSYPTHSNAMRDLLEPNSASEVSPELYRRSQQLNLLPPGGHQPNVYSGFGGHENMIRDFSNDLGTGIIMQDNSTSYIGAELMEFLGPKGQQTLR